MAEQQLIDYIKKARDVGQTDDQTRILLYKNGWTEAEVSDALTAINQPRPQPQSQPEAIEQTKIEIQSQKPQPEIIRQPEPQYQPKFPGGNMSQIKTRSHLVFKILMVLIIVVVLGGAGYFVAGQYLNLPYSNFLWNLFAPNPQTVISNMLTNMKSVKSSHTIMRLEISATNNDSKTFQGKLALNTNSEIDTTDVNNPKVSGNFIINLTLPGSASPVASATVSTAVIGGAADFKISDITIPAAYSYPGLDVSQIKGKWFKIDQDSIKTLSQAGGAQEVTGIDISQISQAQVNSSELTKKIQDLITAENIFSVSKQLNDETISGQNTYHYLITISKDKLNDLINKLIATETSGATNSSTPLVENMAQTVAKTFVDSIGDIDMEVWVGKNDYMLYQVKIDKAIDLSKIAQAYGATIGNNMQIEVKFNMTNSNFNKPITVQAPAGAQKIEDVILPLLKMQKIKSDMNQIGSAAQSIFSVNKNYYLLCKNGFLNGSKKTSYGLEFISAVNDMIKQGAKNPICFAGVQDYCVSTQLTDGSYLCVDKNNVLGKTKCASYKTICK